MVTKNIFKKRKKKKEEKKKKVDKFFSLQKNRAFCQCLFEWDGDKN